MSELNYDNEQIQRYLLKEMSVTENSEFESQMARDPSLKSAVSEAFVLHQMVIEKRLFEVNDLLQEITAVKPKRGKGPFIAGSMVLFALLSGLGYFVFKSEAPEDLTSVTVSEKIEAQSLSEENGQVNDALQVDAVAVNELAVQNQMIPATKTEHATSQDHTVRLTAVEQIEDVQLIEEEVPQTTEKITIVDTPKERVEQTDPVVIEKDPCANKSWALSIEQEPSCKGVNTGQIRIESSLNSVNYAIDDDELGTIHEWEELAAGSYSLHVVDDGGCDTNLTVIIRAEACRLTGPDYDYYLQSDAQLEFRDVQDRKGQILIIDQSGRTIENLVFEEGDVVTWEAKSENGDPLKVGFLSYLIKFEDGDIMKGGITVLP